MVISCWISCVDGTTEYEKDFDSPTEALKWLLKYDHEGSSLSIEVIYDAEEGYKALEELRQKEIKQ